jgi:putative transposase
VAELGRKHGFSQSAFYKWKAKYGGMDASALKRLKELKEENRRWLIIFRVTKKYF